MLVIGDGLVVIGRVVRPGGRRRPHDLCMCRGRSEMTPRGPALSGALRRGPGVPVTRRWPGQGVSGLILAAWCRAARCHLNWSFTLGITAFLLPLDMAPGCWCGPGVRVAGSDLRRRDRA